MQWSHNGETCKEPKFLVLNQAESQFWYLVVQDTDFSDAGEYLVSASNASGKTEVAVHLIVQKTVPPEGSILIVSILIVDHVKARTVLVLRKLCP